MLPIASLVTKMTKREKFYFKKNHPDSENRTFMLLYNYIEKNPKVNSSGLKEAFKTASFYSSISVELNSLYQRLLRTLKVYRINSKEPVYVIQKNLSYILILIEKDEIEQAMKLLLKTKKKAYYHEEFSFLTKLISIEEGIKYNKIDSNIKSILTKLNQERLIVIQEEKSINQLKKLKGELLNVVFHNGVRHSDHSTFSTFDNYGFLDLDNYESSIKGKTLFLDCKAIFNILKGTLENGCTYYKENLDLVYNNPQIFDNFERARSVHNYLFVLADFAQYDQFYNIHNTYLTDLKEHKNISAFIAYADCYLRLRMELKMNNIRNLKPILDETLSSVINHKLKLSLTQKNVVYFQVIYAYITIGKYETALDFIQEWDKHQIEEFSVIKRRLLRIITFYELKKYRLLDSEINSFSKILISRNAQNDFFDYLLKYFKKIIKNPEERELLKHEFYNEMLKYSKIKKFEPFFNEIHFHYWAQPKGDL